MDRWILEAHIDMLRYNANSAQVPIKAVIAGEQ
jgi:hypothetical protein